MSVLRAFALLLLFSVAACGTTTPQADGIPPVGTGGDANGSVGALEVRDARFAAQRPRTGDEVYAAGEDVPLSASIVNSGDATDRLVSVTSPVATDGRIDGDPQIPGGLTLISGYQDVDPARQLPGTIRSDITLVGLREPLRAGLTYSVTFTFARAGAVRIEIPVGDPDTLPPRAEDTTG